jgi:hypothetical protein
VVLSENIRDFGDCAVAIPLLSQGWHPNRGIMNIDYLRAAIEQHICVVAGVPYQFRLEWCATEKYVEPASGRTLLNIECIATADSNKDCVPLHVMVWLTDLGALRGILQDALHMALERTSVAESDSDSTRPETPPTVVASTLQMQ